MNKSKNGLASLIIGAVAIIFSAIEVNLVFIIIGILISLAAILCGLIAMKKEKNILNITGIALGICGELISALWIYLYIITR